MVVAAAAVGGGDQGGAGLVYLTAAEAALGAAAEGDTSVRVRVLGGGLGRWGHGQGGLGQADTRDLRQIPAASGQQMPLMNVTQGPASRQYGARFFSL